MNEKLLEDFLFEIKKISKSLEEIKELIADDRKEHIQIEDDLPDILTVQEITDILRINTTKAYELTHRADFSSIKLGRRIIIPKDKFFEWLNKESEQWIE